ncbi:hypothetical protein ACI5KX_14905, partial [Erythrobacter sp. GH1-10]
EGEGSTFAGTAMQDDAALGSGRLLFLAGVIGPLALLRVAAGTLLALAPVVAALWFFAQSRGIFAGWLKGLMFTFAGSIGVTVLLGVELAIIEPWLTDALQVRSLGYATPSAPTELFAIMLAFAIVQLAMLWLLAKVVFHRGWQSLPSFPAPIASASEPRVAYASTAQSSQPQILRAERISTTVENTINRERNLSSERFVRTTARDDQSVGMLTTAQYTAPRLGSSYRRPSTRPSRAAVRRDKTNDR